MKTFLSASNICIGTLLLVLGVAPFGSAANYFSGDQLPTCTLKVGEKVYHLNPSQTGAFPCVSGIARLATIPIEVKYPSSERRERVILEVTDSGNIDGKGLKVMQLDEARTLAFNFQVSDEPGIYRVTVRKGNADAYTIQLWVEAKPSPKR